MTPERMQRLLRAGAHLYARSDGQWDLYRCSDRRRRRVGVLGPERVEALRAGGEVLRQSIEPPECLVWSRRPRETGAMVPPLPGRPDGGTTPSQDSGRVSQSLLARVLASEPREIRRRRLAVAALNWRQDIEAVQSLGLSSGMNWTAIQAGTRIDGGGYSFGGFAGQTSAQDRLRAIERQLSRDERRLLNLLIIKGWTRHAVARSTGLSDRRAEQEAAKVLCRIADLFEKDVRRPGQGTRSV